jgi:hypothetical protein
VDPATQREAREHLMRAGEYYRLHAARSVQTDSKGYGDSLWAAADMFDRAGDLSSSASAFQQFAADFPGDSRKATALFRLAEAQRAGGDMEAAARIYRELIAGRASSRESGPIADESYVPLAITLLGDHKTENDAEAEEHLLLDDGWRWQGTSPPSPGAAGLGFAAEDHAEAGHRSVADAEQILCRAGALCFHHRGGGEVSGDGDLRFQPWRNAFQTVLLRLQPILRFQVRLRQGFGSNLRYQHPLPLLRLRHDLCAAFVHGVASCCRLRPRSRILRQSLPQ